jgi:hypothetical protein
MQLSILVPVKANGHPVAFFWVQVSSCNLKASSPVGRQVLHPAGCTFCTFCHIFSKNKKLRNLFNAYKSRMVSLLPRIKLDRHHYLGKLLDMDGYCLILSLPSLLLLNTQIFYVLSTLCMKQADSRQYVYFTLLK